MNNLPIIESKKPGFKIYVTVQGCSGQDCTNGLEMNTMYAVDLKLLLGITDADIIAAIQSEKACD